MEYYNHSPHLYHLLLYTHLCLLRKMGCVVWLDVVVGELGKEGRGAVLKGREEVCKRSSSCLQPITQTNQLHSWLVVTTNSNQRNQPTEPISNINAMHTTTLLLSVVYILSAIQTQQCGTINNNKPRTGVVQTLHSHFE